MRELTIKIPDNWLAKTLTYLTFWIIFAFAIFFLTRHFKQVCVEQVFNEIEATGECR